MAPLQAIAKEIKKNNKMYSADAASTNPRFSDWTKQAAATMAPFEAAINGGSFSSFDPAVQKMKELAS